jgi:cyclohexadieny/prephenate dehydrogenase
MPEQITIVGGGMIGASLGLALRGRAAHVSIVEPDDATRARLATMAAADRIEADLAACAATSNLVVIAAPIAAIGAIGRTLALHAPRDALVTDACSVKAAVERDLAPLADAGIGVVPAHPLAGGHLAGPQSARADLFAGKRCILCPPPGAGTQAVAGVRRFWEGLDMLVDIMPAEQHDMVMALTSHLPHLVAFAAVACAHDAEQALDTPVLRYAASGFRDFTRIAAADPALWRDILRENRAAVLATAARLDDILSALTQALDTDDADAIEAMLTQASATRRSLAA